MRITSQLICQAADQLNGFVGLNRKTGQHIVRFSEDSFGMDVADDNITPASEFVWHADGADTNGEKNGYLLLTAPERSLIAKEFNPAYHKRRVGSSE